MEEDKRNKLSEMLKHMSDYSIEQPKAIDDLCQELFVSPAYGPAMDLLVESFLTVYSFVLLMSEGLISSASAILRILIEQVAAVTVISENNNAMTEFLKFQTKKKQYYGSTGVEHERIREYLFKECGYKHKNESALKDYLDYGWIRAINNDKSQRSDKLIIKEAHLEEFIADINEQLNAFAHGQGNMFLFLRNKDLADMHVSRIIMIAGKLFLFLCHSKRKLLFNESIESDKQFSLYLNAKILFLDLNARAINERIIEIIKKTTNLDKDIILSLSTIEHIRGLIYRSELNYIQVNVLARAYVLDLINFTFMICFKLFGESDNFFDGIKSLSDLLSQIGLERVEQLYKSQEHLIPLSMLIEMINRNDDNWVLMRSEGQMSELDENFITDFTSLIHALFEAAYPNVDADELLKPFITID